MKRYKGFLSLLAVIVMFICFLQVYTLTTFAADADTSWYSSSSTSFTLYDAADLVGFASLVNAGNDFDGKTIKLGSNINLNSEAWTPIGNSTSYPFKGTFDGQGYTVQNLNVNENGRAGLFGYADGSAIIENVTVTGSVSGSSSTGGIVGCIGSDATVKNCTNSAACNSSYSVGGVVGSNIGTITNCYNSGSITGNNYVGGMVGHNEGTVTNCINSGTVTSASTGYDYVGGLVGFIGKGTVTNCCNSGAVSGYRCVGGVVGTNNVTVTSCYNSGTISCTSQMAGGVVGYNYSGASITNCYYLNTTAGATYRTNEGTLTNVESKTDTQFASGEVTYLLTGGTTDGTQAWYQNIDNGNTVDSYPVLDSTHGTVYYTTSCDGNSAYYYSNTSVSHVGGSYDSNGFCTRCGSGYQPAVLNNGVYEISNAGQLFWFASLINGDTTQDGIIAAVSNANAVLISNINLGTTTSTHTSTEWTPIGSESAPFSGTFDGGGYTVSGMSITKSADYVGLFGYVTGTVKNMTVDGSINVTSSGGIGVGGIVGCVYAGTLSHLTSTVNITGYDDTKGNYAGIVGSAMGDNNTAGSTVEECVYSGELTASGNLDCIGGIVGYINAAAINNCANLGTVDTTGGTSGGIYTGGILGYCNNTSAVVKNSYNYGTVKGAGSYIGAVVGRINTNIGSLSNCYYLSGTAGAGYGANAASIDPGSNITVKTAEEFASGEVAWLLQNANNNYVWGQHLTGSTTDAYPIIKSNAGNEEDRVVCIEFYKLSNTIPYAYRYTNVDKTIAEYPGDGTYKFYRYSDLTGEIDTTTTTFTDNDCLYMYAQRDLIISKTNGDEAIEDADYTYENNILTVIYGGEYTIEMNAGITSTTDTIKVDTSDDVTITLAGVNITSEYGSGKAPFEIAEGGNVTIKLSGENTLTSESSGNAGLQLTNANLIITSADGDGEITGSLEAAGDSTYSAGIGSGYRKDFGSIIINGGTITATGSTYGAGIGGASRGGGSITINGGNVSASSRAGAGIGGGTTNSYSIITITGGTVDASSNSGAAIGGGQGSEGTVTVNISGGYITVSINNSEADCIGSGTYSSSTDTVTITGGYFGSGSVTDETVYDVTAAAGYSVFNNNDTATNGTYPVYVEAAYTVTQSLTNVTSSNTDTKVIAGGSYSTTLTGTDCYVLPDSITVTAGGTELTAGTDYTYDSSTGELTISNVTGNIVITAAAANTSHSYDGGEVTTKATCTTDGVMTYTCTVCSDTYTEAIPATGHTTETKNAKEATCTEDGYTGDEVCTVCGETITAGEVIPATGHTIEIQNAKAATCTEDGYTGDEVCTVCGETVESGEVIPATGHTTEIQNAKAATCTEDGYTGDEICTVCGETITSGETIPALGHTTEVQNAKGATCTEDGYTGDTVCTVCGETVESGEVIPATGHTTEVQNAKDATCTEDGYTGDEICTVCGETITAGEVIPATGHTTEIQNAKEATCTEDGYTGDEICTVCGETITAGETIPATGHTTEVQNAKAATCTEDGYTGDEICTVCGETITAGEVIPATGHTTEIQNAKEATCTEDGYTGDEVCTVCGETITAGEVILATGHTTEVQNAKDATCTEDGYTGDEICTVCGETVTTGNVIPATGHTTETQNAKAATCTTDGYTGDEVCTICGETVAAGNVIPATGHTTEIQNAKDATCTTDGYTGDEVCTICGETVSTGSVIPATGHTTEIQNAKEATCTADGYTGDEVCTVCGETISTGSVIPATSHTTEIQNAKEATCIEEGYTGDEVCTICGETISTGTVIPATGHITEIQNAKEATCIEEGYTGDEVCTVCGETITTGEVIPTTGHSYDGGVITSEASCTADGVITYTCTICGDTYTEVIPAVGHSYDGGVITSEANCTTDGVITYTCTVCGDTYTEAIPATGHSYDSSVITKEATCTEDGEMTYTCTVCGDTVTEAIPATGHTEVIDPRVEPTCTETGLTEGSHCSVCGTVIIKQEEIPATGHSYDEGSVTTEPTCTAEGVMTYTCTNCGHTYTESIAAKGHTEVIDEAVEATCTENGLTEGSHCSECGIVIKAQEIIPATGHSYDSGEIIEKAGCTEEGLIQYTCTICGHTYTEVISATGHTEEIDEAVEPTCTENGLTEGSHCSECGAVIVKQEIIPATGHSYDEGTVTAEATCTEDGVMTYTCTVCGETYTEIIPATGHDYSVLSHNDTEHWYECSVCGEEQPGSRENHSGGTAENGEKAVCDVCGAEYGKADPTYTVPTGLTAAYGDTLADVELPSGFAWADSTLSVGSAGTNVFKAVYTPDDTENYNTVTDIEVSVTVAKADTVVTTAPTASSITRGSSLSASTLTGGKAADADGNEIAGTFAWADGTTAMSTTGTFTEKVIFTPSDSTNYNTAECEVSVVVYTKSSGGGGGGGSSSRTTTTTTTTTEATTETTTEDSEEITETENEVTIHYVRVTIGEGTVVVGENKYDMDAAAYIQPESNSTLVPLRFVTVAVLGGSVENADTSKSIDWNGETKTASITVSGKVIEFTAGSNTMIVDGKAVTMDNGVKAEITDGRMYIPFRALGNALGVNVDWEADTKTAVYETK